MINLKHRIKSLVERQSISPRCSDQPKGTNPQGLVPRHEGDATVMLRWLANSRSGLVALLMAACIVAVAIYVLPALMAWSMGSPQRMAITLVSLMLGWTNLGWMSDI